MSEKTAEIEKKYETKITQLESQLKQMEGKMLTQIDSKHKEVQEADKKIQEQ